MVAWPSLVQIEDICDVTGLDDSATPCAIELRRPVLNVGNRSTQLQRAAQQTKLDTMQVLAKSYRYLAAKLVNELEAVMAGGKRTGNV